MKRFSLALTLTLALAAASTGCRRAPSRGLANRNLPRYRIPTLPATERAADLVRRMTVSEKIAQTMNDAPAIPRLGVPAYEWWNEALHGVARADRATVFPQAIGLAATFDDDLVKRVATAISDEARAKFNLAQARGDTGRYHGLTFFSPNLNLFRDPRWGRGHETFGEDPLLTARMGVAFIGGMQGDNPQYWKTVATAKHFAVHSGPEAERHTFDARVSPHDLADSYLPHFEAAVRASRVGSVMAAYNRVNGQPCVANSTLLNDTLRRRWGFLGYVVGDCGAVDDVWAHHATAATPAAAAADALLAGTDLDCGRAYRHLDDALAQGLIKEADLDRALDRLFMARFRLGLFDPPELVPWSKLGSEQIESPAHLKLARQAAARSIVLLENRGALPLGPAIHRLGVVGPMADDLPVLLANYHGIPSHPVRLLDGVRDAAAARGVTVRYAPGARLVETTPSAVANAVAVARDSDAVIAFVGLDPRLEGEEHGTRFNPGGDRLNLDMPAAQRELVEALFATGKPVIVVLTGGSALAVPWLPARAAAVLYSWYPGVEGGHAVADVLFGDVNPAGRLPITIYRSASDLPPFPSYEMSGRTYRYFEGEPLYPFGYGLSYTTFRYTKIGAVGGNYAATAVEIENAGTRAGDEVVQAYILPRDLPPYAPRRWLGGFSRVTLAPGERRIVKIPLTGNPLTLVDETGARRHLTGDVDIAVGGRQPDRTGHYADETQGATTTLHLAPAVAPPALRP
ncbi:MAG TPA: glycoside hydrolase family 3 C-terminal domain-containing protein [Polyangia bacterium]|nr:glycoside hydrolase family 3 C-terminal domain-containing protein [Polyangia bacterium]